MRAEIPGAISGVGSPDPTATAIRAEAMEAATALAAATEGVVTAAVVVIEDARPRK